MHWIKPICEHVKAHNVSLNIKQQSMWKRGTKTKHISNNKHLNPVLQIVFILQQNKFDAIFTHRTEINAQTVNLFQK